MELWQEWWVWLTAGVVLAIIEVVLPGFIFLGFAGGAVLTGIGIWAGFIGSSLSTLLLVFAIASLAMWAALRAIFGRRRGQVKIWHSDINENQP